MALNNDGWEEIFSNLPILEQVKSHGYFDLSADQIKQFGKREPRLMAKIDFREQLPKAMAKNGLAMLAISNGVYRIGRFDPFIDIDLISRVSPIYVNSPSDVLSLDFQALAHESQALDAAHVTGILKTVFREDVALTIRGRSRNQPFAFTTQGVHFPVSGVQIEVDGGYEGATSVNLVEAKIGPRNNISIRQLLYPQMSWDSRIAGRKVVNTFICFYQEPLLRFIPVNFGSNQIRADHANEIAFILEPEARLDIRTIPVNAHGSPPISDAPFPQADNFDTVLAMFSILVREGEISKEQLFLEFDVTPRQIDYYGNVLKWLGLADISNGTVRVTVQGLAVAHLSHAKRIEYLAPIIFSEPIFHHVLHNGPYNVPDAYFQRWGMDSQETRTRRIQTVLAWIRHFEAFSKQGQLGI